MIGINVAYLPPQAGAVSLGFAIPSPTVIDVVGQLLRRGRVDRPFVGVQLVPLSPSLANELDLEDEGGAAVLRVVEGRRPTVSSGRET